MLLTPAQTKIVSCVFPHVWGGFISYLCTQACIHKYETQPKMCWCDMKVGGMMWESVGIWNAWCGVMQDVECNIAYIALFSADSLQPS